MNLLKRVIQKVRHEIIRYQVIFTNKDLSLNREGRNQKVIVSLTSYPKRFASLDLCLKSIFLQTLKPDKIILWLGSDSVNEDISVLNKYVELGLEIYIDKEENLKSHKKYYYAFERFPNDLIVTVDDDLIYPKYMLENLYKTHVKYPDCIVAWRVHRILWKDRNTAELYSKWLGEYTLIEEPSFCLLPTTGAGTLYPPYSICPDYNKIELIKEYAFSCDDIWMKFMSVLNGTKVVWAKNKMQMPTTVDTTNSDGLVSVNCSEGNNNDIAFARLLKYYDLNEDNFGI